MPPTVYRSLFMGLSRHLSGGCEATGNRFKLQMFGGLNSHFHYSKTASIGATYPSFLVDFLILSAGFNSEEALSAAKKVTSSKPRQNPDLVFNYFKEIGLTAAQIKNLLSADPNSLFRNLDKTMKPKVTALQELGFTGSDLVTIVVLNSSIFQSNLDTRFKPNIVYLTKILGSHEILMKTIKRAPWLLSCTPGRISHNIEILEGAGIKKEKITRLLCLRPSLFSYPPKRLNELIDRVERELGIPRTTGMFIHAMFRLASVNETKLDKKFEMFRSFGWSDSDIGQLLRKQPAVLGISDANLFDRVSFFVKELNYDIPYLASHPHLLLANLEKKVKPRHDVLKIIYEKLPKATPKTSLSTALLISEARFLEKFVIPYKEEIPGLYESYVERRGK